jgi:hypothetical protein
VQRAVKTLRIIKQSFREPFSAFLLRFEKALADAEGIAWPNKVKRLHFDGAFTFKLRRLTITIPPIAIYVDEILRVSDFYRSAMRHAPKEQSMAHWETGDIINWESTRAAAAAPLQSG